MTDYARYVAGDGTSPGKSYHSGYVYGSVLNAALGSFFFGYVMSAFNPINAFVQNVAFPGISPTIISFLTSFVPLGAAVGALLAGKIASAIGRRKEMLLIDLLSIIGTVLTVLPNEHTLLVGRLLQGFCVGANSSVTPLYISEVSPSEIQGTLGTYNQLLISTGVLVAPLLGLLMPAPIAANSGNQFFRVILAVAGIAPALRFLNNLIFFRYETPKYLVSVENEEGASAVLHKIYEDTRARDILIELRRQRELDSETGKVTLSDVFSDKYRRRLFVGVSIAIFQQLSGINAIIFFSNSIFQAGTTSTSLPTVYTVITDVLQVLTNVLAGLVIEKLGRRLLLLVGMAYTAAILGAFGVVSIISTESPLLKFFIWGYMFGFGFSIGPIPWVYISDILPDIAIGIAVLANWIFAFSIGEFFPTVAAHLGMSGGFLIFAACSAVGTLFVLTSCLETKGKNESEIAAMFGGGAKETTGSFHKPEY